ncbi:tripartite-type tricarboxylate transporter receptor subunit TctC [Modicisalibacter xianhensis]|uniref:Tripartite-type tricarboxylate transporter receptor subunit TctC n=1 Tax=Modicisalibacter xianhensis TaxID=442341 RepID=A0A4R8F7S4_9GAMM|nr:ABC transporter substrate-binding protein [Halomonas xianhensis]TDX21439.1 tripartite-type tricarboxylate transporter receptor subunit TctC [Halomonas xianhensis]
MKLMTTPLRKLVCAVAIAGTAGVSMTSHAQEDCPVPGNLRVVIGSTSTGGDTYQNSSIVADHLAKKLDINAKVDAVGAMAGFRALDRSRNGNTVMIFHDQAYLGNLYGVKGYDNIFEKYTVGPTVAINPGNAYLVPKDSPYQNIDEVIAAAGEGEEIRVAIQPGGVSEIGFSALKNAVKLKHPGMEKNVVAVNTGSQADKNQLLFDDMADVINGSVQANEQYTRLPEDDQKAMRFVWLTARNDTIKQTNEEGMGKTTREDLLQYVNPNVTVPQSESQNFTFDKEFFFLYNKDMDPKIVSCIDNALEEIYAQGDIQEQQKKSFFIPNFKPSSEAQTYLKDKRDQYATIIENIQ